MAEGYRWSRVRTHPWMEEVQTARTPTVVLSVVGVGQPVDGGIIRMPPRNFPWSISWMWVAPDSADNRTRTPTMKWPTTRRPIRVIWIPRTRNWVIRFTTENSQRVEGGRFLLKVSLFIHYGFLLTLFFILEISKEIYEKGLNATVNGATSMDSKRFVNVEKFKNGWVFLYIFKQVPLVMVSIT